MSSQQPPRRGISMAKTSASVVPPTDREYTAIRPDHWDRLKRVAAKCEEPPDWLGNSLFTCAGLAGGGLLSLFSLFSNQTDPDPWTLAIHVSMTCGLVALSLILLLLWRWKRKQHRATVQEILVEMAAIEKTWPNTE